MAGCLPTPMQGAPGSAGSSGRVPIRVDSVYDIPLLPAPVQVIPVQGPVAGGLPAQAGRVPGLLIVAVAAGAIYLWRRSKK